MNKGDYMVHWSGKVCMVEDMAEMNLTGTKRMYFILCRLCEVEVKILIGNEDMKRILLLVNMT